MNTHTHTFKRHVNNNNNIIVWYDESWKANFGKLATWFVKLLNLSVSLLLLVFLFCFLRQKLAMLASKSTKAVSLVCNQDNP